MKLIIKHELPKCDFCGAKARYDAPTKQGPWANMCQTCYDLHKSSSSDQLGCQFELVGIQHGATEKRQVVKITYAEDDYCYAICPKCRYQNTIEPDADYDMNCRCCGQPITVRGII